jgi:CheY-like chemotaxis protein
MRILVVEDEFLLRLELSQALAAAGYEVDQAANGQIAIEHLRRHRPDLILLDLRMPVMDGFDFRAQQLSDPDLATVPVAGFRHIRRCPHTRIAGGSRRQQTRAYRRRTQADERSSTTKNLMVQTSPSRSDRRSTVAAGKP